MDVTDVPLRGVRGSGVLRRLRKGATGAWARSSEECGCSRHRLVEAEGADWWKVVVGARCHPDSSDDWTGLGSSRVRVQPASERGRMGSGVGGLARPEPPCTPEWPSGREGPHGREGPPGPPGTPGPCQTLRPGRPGSPE